MSWALQFNGLNNYVSIPGYSFSGDFEIKLDFVTGEDVTGEYAIVGTNTAYNTYIRLQDTNKIDLNLSGGTPTSQNVFTFNDDFLPLTRYQIIIKRVGTTVTITDYDLNNLVTSDWLTSTSSFTFRTLGARGSVLNRYFNGGLVAAVFNSDRYYDATLSDHSSSTLTDTISGEDGTISGEVVWSELSEPSIIEGNISFSLSNPVFSVSGSASLPQPVGAIDVSLSPPVFSGSGSSTLPHPVGSISTTLSAPSFVVSGSASLPQPVGIVNFTIDAPTVNSSGSATSATPSGSISITINEPVFSASGGATLPQATGTIDFELSKPVFTATGSASIPSWSATGDITLSKPLFSATGSTTLPQPSGSVELNLSKPVFNVIGSVSGIVIINGTDSTISISAQPNLLTLETKSNTITL